MILARHVSKTTGLAMLGATGLLWFLQVLFSYIGQLGELKADYRAWDALIYILWESPRYLYELLPIAALIGAVVGLGALASNSELVIMRASGVSLWRIVGWVIRPAALLMVLSLAMSEWVLPYTNEHATQARSQQPAALGEVKGYWSRSAEGFRYIRYANDAGRIEGVQLLNVDSQQRLTQIIRAPNGQYAKGTAWQLSDVQQITVANDGHLSAQRVSQQVLDLSLAPKFIHLLTIAPEELAPSQLWQYMQYLSKQGSVPAAYRLAFWQKISAPFALAALVVVACSFIFGPLRQQSVGFRLVIALFVGLGFRYLQDFLGYASLVYSISPMWFVILPIVAMFALGAWALRRMR